MQLQISPWMFPEFTVEVGSLAFFFDESFFLREFFEESGFASLAAGLFKCRAGLE